jgi:hypothetical protein
MKNFQIDFASTVTQFEKAIKKFKVKKSGTTMDDTRYQVIPIL